MVSNQASGSLYQQNSRHSSVINGSRPSTGHSFRKSKAYKNDYIQAGSIEPFIGKSSSISKKSSELSLNCASAALPIFDHISDTNSGKQICSTPKATLPVKSVTLAIDSRGPARPSITSSKIGSCSSQFYQKSAFGSVKKSKSDTSSTASGNSGNSCKSSNSKNSNKNGYISEVENAILRSTDAPIRIKESEEIKGIQLI